MSNDLIFDPSDDEFPAGSYFSVMTGLITPDDAKQAGADCAANGPMIENTKNVFFSAPLLYQAWEKSYLDNNGDTDVLDRLNRRLGNRLWNCTNHLDETLEPVVLIDPKREPGDE